MCRSASTSVRSVLTTRSSGERDRVARYFAAVHRELDLWLPHLRGPFRSLYVGGGTPSSCLDELGQVLERIPVEGERAVEVLPTHATPERLQRLQDMGVSYVSIGVQSFDDAVLHHLGRPMSAEDNLAAVRNSVGRFACVDVDLIFDVGFDNPDVLLRDLETCFELGVDQVSTYPLMRFAYTPFGQARHAPRIRARPAAPGRRPGSRPRVSPRCSVDFRAGERTTLHVDHARAVPGIRRERGVVHRSDLLGESLRAGAL